MSLLRSRAWDIAIALVQAEERAPAVAPVAGVPAGETYYYVEQQTDKLINSMTAIFKCMWSGNLKECLVKTDSSNYRIRVTNEAGEIYNNSYSFFREHSRDIESLAAFEDNGTFIFHITDISFDGYFAIEIIPENPLTVKLFHIHILRRLK